MSVARWAFVHGSLGWIEVYVVDEHGCQLNTEPVMTLVEKWHSWFIEWLKAQPCEYPIGAPLLWHPALGESYESYTGGAQ